jgi:hypothetical protein
MPAAEAQQAMDAVRELIARQRGEIIPFRRRQFETDAMLTEIFRRCDLHTAASLRLARPADAPELCQVWSSTHAAPLPRAPRPAEQLARHGSWGKRDHVAIVWTHTGMAMKSALEDILTEEGLDVADAMAIEGGVYRVIRVLLVLSEGAMADAKVTSALSTALRAGYDIVVVQDSTERAGLEAASAPASVRSIFAQHEFMEYRTLPHEQRAMFAELLRRFVRADTR